MKLSLDPRSEAWRFVQEHAEKRLDDLRVQNDRMTTPEDTANTRGQIRAWKELLALPERANPAQPAGDQDT